MLKIRPHAFETNSSSNDYYYDDDYYDMPRYGDTRQDVIIEVEWLVDNNKIQELYEDDVVFEDIDKLFADYYKDSSDDYRFQDNLIIMTYPILVDIVDWEPGCAQTRYCPGEPPCPIFDDKPNTGGFPLKNEEFLAKPKLLQEIENTFEKHGYKGYAKAVNLYADNIDEDYLWDNLDW